MKKVLLPLLLLFSQPAHSSGTYWELGAGMIGLNVPAYLGASNSESYLLPFPYFRIKSDYFEIDEGIRGFLLESPDFRLNISADLGVPVNSDEDTPRSGMPDLDAVIQFGPSMEYIFAGGRKQAYEVRLELPLRAAISVDLDSVQNIGWVAEPRFTYETLRQHKHGWASKITTGLRFATQDYHAYYYDVAAEFATPGRPVYKSQSGYNSAFIDLVGSYRQKDLIYFAFIRYQNLSGSTFEDSPLIEQQDAGYIGIGLVWVLADSQ